MLCDSRITLQYGENVPGDVMVGWGDITVG